MWEAKRVETYPREWKIFIPRGLNTPGHEDNLLSLYFYTQKEAQQECHRRNQEEI
jgi:hypothetical protein